MGALTLLFFGVQLCDFNLQTINSFSKCINSEGKCSSLDKQLPKHILRILTYKHAETREFMICTDESICLIHAQYTVYIFIIHIYINMSGSSATCYESFTPYANDQHIHTQHSEHSLRLPSWRMMLARLILVTHSSSLRMLEGMVWRHTCRGSIFLVTKGMMGCGG